VPVALDGFIAGAAALVAVTLAPDARHALFASHRSAEPGHARALEHLRLEPYLDLGLRLGEGTGAALFVHLARAAAVVWSEMATFKGAGISEQSEGASMAPSEASPTNPIAPATPAREQRP
jgi:nicotinate-nucleotide--dimethylbenzimidazole phosphoribosyltransferase